MNKYNPLINHTTHSNHFHHVSEFKRKLLVSLILTIPILLLSHMVQEWLGFSFKPPFNRELLFTLSLIVYVYSGSPFLKGLVKEIGKRQPGMMTLVGTAVSVAFIYSAGAVLIGYGKDFFWELVTLIDIMLLGHWVEAKSVLGASEALEKLVKIMPATAHLLNNSETIDVPVSELKVGDIVLVKPGEKIPSDGIVVEGESSVDESLLTGESKPVRKAKGSTVIGGAINGEGALKIRIERTGEDTYLSQVVKLVKQAQESKSRVQDLADKAAAALFYVALVSGIVTFLVWFPLKGLEFSLERTVTVLVIACPHALGLAIPLVVAISSSITAKNGILVRNRKAFENLRNINAVVFDKTGTLTKGNFMVTDVISLIPEEELLRLTAGVEYNSEHAIAKAIVVYAKEKNISIPEVEEFNALPGIGVYGRINGMKVYVGSLSLLKEMGIELSDGRIKTLQDQDETLVFTIVDGKLVGVFAISDEVREESYDAVKKLKELGLKIYMLTGDSEKVAKSVAEELGVEEYFAQISPDEKADKVRSLREMGLRVAMVGDGVNDAPALATADVGIAIGAGTDVAIESADIILVKNDPRDIVKIIDVSRKTYSKMVQNLLWAAGYNIITIPLAAGILYEYGVTVPPALGALIMSLSTIIVALNSQTLRKYDVKDVSLREEKYITIDPVCGMQVSPEDAYSRVKYDEYVIYFCSKRCREEFEKNAEKYIRLMKEKSNRSEHRHH